ncbi:hypothetical protein SCLCIDRAFT_1211100 [Scleroderma citrinum Foug A]|uniref:Uncharacterized protein n=1 Tax=Scleroderma citrinum Foug A TaxID=1036808 RepID=A0A0C2ZZ67_9AGAM|nr:hypothetical protein SCLCIDRAFT_1211100 [Scleroderma citrinum Foug A]
MGRRTTGRPHQSQNQTTFDAPEIRNSSIEITDAPFFVAPTFHRNFGRCRFWQPRSGHMYYDLGK